MTITIEDIWREVDNALQKKLNPETYSNWIAVIKPRRIEGDELVLSVSNDFYFWWIEEHYLSLISEAAAAACGKRLQVRLEVDPALRVSGAGKQDRAAPDKQRRPAASITSGKSSDMAAVLNPKYVFDSFVVGSSNSFGHASSLAVAQAPGRAYNPLFLYGGIGLGKTHLMQAIGNYIIERSAASVRYLSCETMLNEYIKSLQSKSTEAFRKKYRSTDILLVDDVHFLSGKDGLQEEFFHTFNQLFNSRKQIVMTSDRAAGEISGLEKRLVTRFEWGLVADLCPPDFETRMAILRSKQKSFNVVLSEDVITFIASHIRSNIRSLEGALTRITSYATFCKQPITMTLVEEQLQTFIEQEKTEAIGIPVIQRKVADYFDIRLSDMTSPHRNHSVSFPRQIAMYLCRRMTPASFPEIGTAFDKTHATVLHAHKVVDKKRRNDAQLDRLLLKFEKQLNPDGSM